MMYVSFKEIENVSITLHIGQAFTTNAAKVTEVQADGDELDLIVNEYPFLYNGKRAQTFSGTTAKMIIVFWQKSFNSTKEITTKIHTYTQQSKELIEYNGEICPRSIDKCTDCICYHLYGTWNNCTSKSRMEAGKYYLHQESK